MSRVKPQNVESNERMHLLDLLWTSIAELDSRDQVKAFFKDLLSEGEAIMLGRRIKIAQWLLQDIGYDEISRRLGTSKATIASVHRWLSGGFKGYEAAIKKFETVVERRHREIELKQKRSEPFSYEWLKRKYPLHFLLFTMMDEWRAKNASRNIKKK